MKVIFMFPRNQGESENIGSLLEDRLKNSSFSKALIQERKVTYTAVQYQSGADSSPQDYFFVMIDADGLESGQLTRYQNQDESLLQSNLSSEQNASFVNRFDWIAIEDAETKMHYSTPRNSGVMGRFSSVSEDESKFDLVSAADFSQAGTVWGFELEEGTNKLTSCWFNPRNLGAVGGLLNQMDEATTINREPAKITVGFSGKVSCVLTNANTLTFEIPASEKSKVPYTLIMRIGSKSFTLEKRDKAEEKPKEPLRLQRKGMGGLFQAPRPLEEQLISKIKNDVDLREAIKNSIRTALQNLRRVEDYDHSKNGRGGRLFTVRSKDEKHKVINGLLGNDPGALFDDEHIQKSADIVHYGTKLKAALMNAFNNALEQQDAGKYKMYKSRKVMEALREVYTAAPVVQDADKEEERKSMHSVVSGGTGMY